ncbi:hypothetical protein SEVIR_5G177545v4 [Setaria viridis]|uniref:Uncharacterized protein n=2 Tax=Setaria TaxID=4554 RepID=A0A368PF09_SETIT|nr:uncharacterized protein LOC117854713 [Setaria viridis]RCU61427.1 hypothetical protein SETIT_J001000v2 [Setaria italica]TKW14589.1 hypothetical protein SEVIR_5G177545v2 [Setaria viridis]
MAVQFDSIGEASKVKGFASSGSEDAVARNGAMEERNIRMMEVKGNGRMQVFLEVQACSLVHKAQGEALYCCTSSPVPDLDCGGRVFQETGTVRTGVFRMDENCRVLEGSGECAGPTDSLPPVMNKWYTGCDCVRSKCSSSAKQH